MYIITYTGNDDYATLLCVYPPACRAFIYLCSGKTRESLNWVPAQGSRYVTFNVTYVSHTTTVFVVEPTTVVVCGVRYVKRNVAPAPAQMLMKPKFGAYYERSRIKLRQMPKLLSAVTYVTHINHAGLNNMFLLLCLA